VVLGILFNLLPVGQFIVKKRIIYYQHYEENKNCLTKRKKWKKIFILLNLM
jgi:hypothetical protein